MNIGTKDRFSVGGGRLYMNMKRFFLPVLVIALLSVAVSAIGAAEDIDATQALVPLQEIALVEVDEECYAAGLIQARLVQLGYYDGPVDNVLSEETAGAIALFQEASGLEADGIATPELQIALLGEGALSAEGETFAVFNPATDLPEGSYIGNRNTHKFHLPDCASVGEMKDKNKRVLCDREAAEAGGYKPCQRCNP